MPSTIETHPVMTQEADHLFADSTLVANAAGFGKPGIPRNCRSGTKRLERKIRRLHAVRSKDIRAINTELSLTETEFDSDERYPKHPLHKFDDGRLMQRG